MSAEAIIPIFPLNVVLMPEMALPLHIFEERYKLMIRECLEQNTEFGIVLSDGSRFRSCGCTARIAEVLKRYDDGRMDILTHGRHRFVLREVYDDRPYLRSKVVFFDDTEESFSQRECQKLADRGLKLLQELKRLTFESDQVDIADRLDIKSISFLLAGRDELKVEDRQRLLEMTSVYDRLSAVIGLLEDLVAQLNQNAQVRKVIGGNGDFRHR
jgi:Lon protease-like protein